MARSQRDRGPLGLVMVSAVGDPVRRVSLSRNAGALDHRELRRELLLPATMTLLLTVM
ncbi:MAG: hypothetical protein ACO318_02190 [Pontimonas sp.]